MSTNQKRNRLKRLLIKYPKCALCGLDFTKNDPYTRDHIVPKSLGGSGHISNIQLVHFSCNQNKGNSIISKKVIKHIFVQKYNSYIDRIGLIFKINLS